MVECLCISIPLYEGTQGKTEKPQRREKEFCLKNVSLRKQACLFIVTAIRSIALKHNTYEVTPVFKNNYYVLLVCRIKSEGCFRLPNQKCISPHFHYM